MNEFMGGDERSRFFRWGSWAMLILTIFLAAQTLGSFKGISNDPVYNSITVSGEGEVTAIPDVATFNFSVSADAKDVATAQSTVNDKMEAIITELKNLGVEEKDIKTLDYSVWPKYRYETSVMPCTQYSCPPSGRQIPDGYTASQNVLVKVRKTDDAGKLLGVVGEKGATNISSISFEIDDPEALQNEARAKAIADAKAKAKILAKQLGVRMVRVVSYSDSNGYYPPMPYYRDAVGMGGAEMSTKAVSSQALPQGENTIKMTVNVVYEIR